MTSFLLQWDRAFDSAEGSKCDFLRRHDFTLQWDRAFDSAEGCLWLRWPRGTLCFNGTAHLIARKAQFTDLGQDHDTLLQWDRAFDSAEGWFLFFVVSSVNCASMGPRI